MNSGGINWENMIEKPIPIMRAEFTSVSMKQIRKEEIARDSAAFKAKIEADLKRMYENNQKGNR